MELPTNEDGELELDIDALSEKTLVALDEYVGSVIDVKQQPPSPHVSRALAHARTHAYVSALVPSLLFSLQCGQPPHPP